MGDIGGITVAFRYATLLIDYMWERSNEVLPKDLAEYGYPIENDDPVRLFVGNIRTEATILGISPSGSNEGMQVLNAMRCTTTIRSGGPKTKSIYILSYKPTAEQYQEFRQRQGNLSRRIAPSKFDQLLNDMIEMKAKIKQLEKKLADVELFLIEKRPNDGLNV